MANNTKKMQRKCENGYYVTLRNFVTTKENLLPME